MNTNAEDDGVKFPQGTRFCGLEAAASKLWDSLPDGDDLIKPLMEINQKQCDPPLSESDVTKIALRVAQRNETGGPSFRNPGIAKIAEKADKIHEILSSDEIEVDPHQRLRLTTLLKHPISWLSW